MLSIHQFKHVTPMKNKQEIFESVLQKMLDTYKKKNHDYSVNGKSSFEKSFENFGLTSLAIRLSDKVDRLTAFAKGNELQVTDEKIEDTILDTAVYSVLGLVEIAFQKQNIKEG